MRNIIIVAKKELFRFFTDKRLLFSTIILPGLMIYILYSFMGEAGKSASSVNNDYQTMAYIINMPDSLKPAFDQLQIRNEPADDMEQMKKNIEDKNKDILIVFPEKFDMSVATYDKLMSNTPAPQIQIFYNSSRKESSKAYAVVTSMLNEYESSMINKFDINSGDAGMYDLASDKDSTAQIFSQLFPMLLLMMAFSGCMAFAPEAIAGEKERGTLTTILVTPIKRSQLAIGKILSLSAVAVLSACSSFVGVALSLPKLVQMEGESGISANVYDISDYIMLLIVLISSVIVIIGVISIMSAFAKSVKEAGTLVAPIMIIVMVIGITAMFGDGAKTEYYWYCIPLYNSVQSMIGIFSFTADGIQIAITVISNIIYGGLFALVLTKMFDSERIMYSK